MAYEFKKLNDVEIVETPMDTANVLIEEDGVIKRAPKSAVGGGGNVQSDIALAKNIILDRATKTITIGTYVSSEFNYESVEEYYYINDASLYDLVKTVIDLGCGVAIKTTTDTYYEYEIPSAVNIHVWSNAIRIIDFYINNN